MGLPNIDFRKPIDKGTNWLAYDGPTENADSLAHALGWRLLLLDEPIHDPDALKRALKKFAEWLQQSQPESLVGYLPLIVKLFQHTVIVHRPGDETETLKSERPELPPLRFYTKDGTRFGVVTFGNERPIPSEDIVKIPYLLLEGKVRKVVSVQLMSSNSIENTSCACKVTPMDAGALELDVVDSPKEAKRSLFFVPLAAHPNPKAFRFVTIPVNKNRYLSSHDYLVNQVKKHFTESKLRCDWYAGSALKHEQFIASTDPTFLRLFPFEEQCYYAQRALLVGGAAGVFGSMDVLQLPEGAYAPLAKKLPNSSKTLEKVFVQVHDGWGYIKACLAEKLRSSNSELSKVKQVGVQVANAQQPQVQKTPMTRVSLGPPSGGYQMFQWFRAGQDQVDLEDKAILELAKVFRANPENDAPKLSEGHTLVGEMWAKRLLLHGPELYATHPLVRRLLRRALLRQYDQRMLTGDPPMTSGVAMPVCSTDVVIPTCERLSGFDTNGKGVALFRHPADTMNWVTAPSVDRSSALAEWIGGLEAIQYTLLASYRHRNAPDDPDVFCKGMLGIIPDDQWPEAWEDASLVVCNKDVKANALWSHPIVAELYKSAPAPRQLHVEGALTICQWFAPGNCIGVPYDQFQSKLAGDYDGDQVVLLAQHALPKTFEWISVLCEDRPTNPKLEKTLRVLKGDESRLDCIEKIIGGAPLVGTWTNISSHLLALDPKTLNWFAENAIVQLNLRQIAPQFTNATELLQRVSLGIKEGTDAFKTRVDVSASTKLSSALYGLLRDAGLLAAHVQWKNRPDVEWDIGSVEAPYGFVAKMYQNLASTHGVLQMPAVGASTTFLIPLVPKDTLYELVKARLEKVLAIYDDSNSVARKQDSVDWLRSLVQPTGPSLVEVVQRAWNALHSLEHRVFVARDPFDRDAIDHLSREFALFDLFITEFWNILETLIPAD